MQKLYLGGRIVGEVADDGTVSAWTHKRQKRLIGEIIRVIGGGSRVEHVWGHTEGIVHQSGKIFREAGNNKKFLSEDSVTAINDDYAHLEPLGYIDELGRIFRDEVQIGEVHCENNGDIRGAGAALLLLFEIPKRVHIAGRLKKWIFSRKLINLQTIIIVVLAFATLGYVECRLLPVVSLHYKFVNTYDAGVAYAVIIELAGFGWWLKRRYFLNAAEDKFSQERRLAAELEIVKKTLREKGKREAEEESLRKANETLSAVSTSAQNKELLWREVADVLEELLRADSAGIHSIRNESPDRKLLERCKIRARKLSESPSEYAPRENDFSSSLKVIERLQEELKRPTQQEYMIACTNVFVNEAQGKLTRRAAILLWSGILCLVFLAVLLLTTMAHATHVLESYANDRKYIPVTALIRYLFSALTYAGLVFVGIKGLLAVGRACLHEAEGLYDRRHALRFGRLYVYLYYADLKFKEIEEAFQWNKVAKTAFLDIIIKDVADTPTNKLVQAISDGLGKAAEKGTERLLNSGGLKDAEAGESKKGSSKD